MNCLRVLVIGDDAPGSGGLFYAEAFRRAGQQVELLSGWEGLEQYRTSLSWRAYRRLTGGVWERHRRRHAAFVIGAAETFRPQLIVVLKGVHLGPDEVTRLKAISPLVVNVNHDDFFSRYRLNRSRVQRAAIPVYDHILTTREVNVAEVRPLNPRVEFFPFAYEPRSHRPAPIVPSERERWEVDVVFVGTYAPQRARLMEQLVCTVPAVYAVHGGQWHKLGRRSPLRPYIRSGEVIGDDLCKALGGAKIALGFLRRENRDDYTQRSFEIPACGGLMLAERTARHLSFYREGEEAEFFDSADPAELFEKVSGLLRDEARRTRIRAAGQAAVARLGHTYDCRIERLLALFGDSKRLGR